MRGPITRARLAALPMLFAIAAVAAGCGSSGADAASTTTAPTTTSASATTTASATPAPAATKSPAPATASAAAQSPDAASNRGRNQDADVPQPLVKAGVPCATLNTGGHDDATGQALECVSDGAGGLEWVDRQETKVVRWIGEPCEPKLEAVAWSVADVELMCADNVWVVAP